jgi:amino acid adenylation domain-containing protein
MTQQRPSAHVTVHRAFEAQARRTPEAVAARGVNGAMSYADLDRRANQLAHLLVGSGVGPERTVAIGMAPGTALVVAMLGVLKAGGAYVPLDPRDAVGRRDRVLRDSGAKVLLTDGRSGTGAAGGCSVVRLDPDWGVLHGQPDTGPSSTASTPERAAYVLYTSGSTGEPKGVVVEHRQVIAYTRAILDRLGIVEPLSYAMIQPLSVDSAITCLLPPLVTGGQVHLIPRQMVLDGGSLADWTTSHGVDLLKIAPSHLRALQRSPHFPRLLPRRLLVVGGEPSDWRWLQALQREVPTGCRVFNHYGPTETTVGVTTLAVDEHPAAEWSTAPIGTELPGTRIWIADPDGRALPDGEEGELVVTGAQVARGYHNRPELTTASFVDGPPDARQYRTGDLGRRLPDGTIQFLGRWDEQIKVRGFRIEPGEIEAAIIRRPGVRQAVVVVREDSPGDRRIVGYVEPHDPAGFDTEDLRRALRELLPPQMVPASLVSVAELPRTGHGKIDRAALPAPANPRGAAGGSRSELEQLVADEWAKLLKVSRVEPDQSFFDLGGHSLLLVELQHRLAEVAGRDIEVLDLLEHSTVRAQAQLLSRPPRATDADVPAQPEVPSVPDNSRLARRQRQLRDRNAGSDE